MSDHSTTCRRISFPSDRTVRRASLGVVLAFALAVPALAGVKTGIAAFVRGDYATAAETLTPDAEAGDAEAQFYLGLMYASGLGVEQDYLKAIDWYRKAADQDMPQAQYQLGQLYESGEVFERDYETAAELYRAAAQWGYAPAQTNLGSLYQRGLGVERDFMQAYFWLTLAVKRGYPEARQIQQNVARSIPSSARREADEVVQQWKPKTR